MKWPITPLGRKGDTRTLVRFAWHPVRLETDQAVWLERYRIMQEVKRVTSGWCPIPYLDWVEIEKLPMEPVEKWPA